IRIPRAPIIAHTPLRRVLDDCGGVHVVAHPKLHCRHRQVDGLIVRPQELRSQRRQRVALLDDESHHFTTTARVREACTAADVRLGTTVSLILGAVVGYAGTHPSTLNSVRLWINTGHASSNSSSTSRLSDTDRGRDTRNEVMYTCAIVARPPPSSSTNATWLAPTT